MGPKIRFGVWMMIIVAILVLYSKNFTGAQAEPITSIEIEKLEKPQRPRVFTSPEELKAYLGALARYYATVSRNRFGKRSSSRSAPAENSNAGDPFSPNEVYDLLRTNNDK